MGRSSTSGQIDKLAGYVNEPYREEEVLAAARKQHGPFLLREAIDATGLPAPVVQRVLRRLVKKGVLTRRKVIMTYPGLTGGQTGGRGGTLRWIPGGNKRRVWLYSLVETAG